MSVHTVSSDLPVILPSLAPIVADCGKIVLQPRLAFLWDEQEMQEQPSWGFSVCRRCRQSSDKKHVRYVYGVTRGEEAEAASA